MQPNFRTLDNICLYLKQHYVEISERQCGWDRDNIHPITWHYTINNLIKNFEAVNLRYKKLHNDVNVKASMHAMYWVSNDSTW